MVWQVPSLRMSPGQRMAPAAFGLHQTYGLIGVGFFLGQVAEHHVDALAGEGERDGAADSGVGPGDHCPLAGESITPAVGVLTMVWSVLHGLAESGMGLLLISVLRLLVLRGRIGLLSLVSHVGRSTRAAATETGAAVRPSVLANLESPGSRDVVVSSRFGHHR
jgi:hypothetical protein